MLTDLPTEFDVIVIGTGVVETILAGACARIGKTVLNIDTNDFYGSDWAAFPLNDLLEWSQSPIIPVFQNSITSKDENENEIILPIRDPSEVFRNRQFKWHIEESDGSTGAETKDTPKVTLQMLKKQSRKFNIDLAPKMYYSTGGMIDILVQSNVARYCEFKLVSRLLYERDGRLDIVPSSRADIFNSDQISLIDKRLLMKVMMNISSMNIDDLQQDQDIPFIEYLKAQKLSDGLCHLIINSISMVDYTATAKEGVTKAKRYLHSIGRYGNSPFLYQMYGSGEISQCFSRLCGVFGGICFLRFPLAGLLQDRSTNQCTGIVATTGERFRAKDAVICNHSYLPSMESSVRTLHRTVLITNRSIKASEREEITYLRLSQPNESGIHVIEIGSATHCTPDGYFLLYIFQEQPQTPSTVDTDQVIDRLLALTGDQFTRAHILGQLTFTHTHSVSSSHSTIPKLTITHGPDASIDHDSAVETARQVFHQIYSNGEEFLPRAPDPEDIIFDDASQADQPDSQTPDAQDSSPSS